MKPAKTFKLARVCASIAVLAITAALVALGKSHLAAEFQFMTSLLTLSLGACLFWLGVTLLAGRAYCSSVCPLGTVQDIAAWIARHTPGRRNRPYRFAPADNRLRYLVLLLVAVSVTDENNYITSLSDPFLVFRNVVSYLAFLPAGMQMLCGFAGAAVVMAAVVFLAARDGRTFCNTVCPVGTMLGTVAKAAVFRFEIDPDICTACGKCEQACKASCISTAEHTIDHSRCVMCVNCIAACNDHAIKFTSSRKRLSTPLMQKIPQLNSQVRCDGIESAERTSDNSRH